MNDGNTKPIDPDALLSTVQISRLLLREGSGCKAHRFTVNRWCSKGINVCGTRVKLRATRFGGRWLARWADVLAFQERCTELAGGECECDRIETPTERRQRTDAAKAELEKLYAKIFPKKCAAKPAATASKGS